MTNLAFNVEAINSMEDIQDVRNAATSMGIVFSGNSGIKSLRKKIINKLKEVTKSPVPLKEISHIDLGGDDEPIEIAKPILNKKLTIAELLKMDANYEKDVNIRRQIVRAKAMNLIRVRITNLDPNDSQLSGGIMTVYNKYTGKVAKYIPFGEESDGGYHVPQILLNFVRSQKFAQRKEIKGGQFGVKRYKTTMINKFVIEVLPPLTSKELAELAAVQIATQRLA